MAIRGGFCVAFLVLFVFPALAEEAGPRGWSNERLAARMIGIGFAGTEVTPEVERWISGRGVGAIVLYRTNAADPVALRRLTSEIARTAAGGPGPILAIDQEGGALIRYEPAAIPSAMAIAATGSEEVAREAGQYVGCVLAAAGVTMNLAPVADLSIPDDPSDLGTRVFSSSPQLAGAMAAAYINGLHRAGILAAVKHFPGQGYASADPHDAAARVTRTKEQIASEDLVPFRSAISAGADAVMTAHAAYPNWPGAGEETATFSRALVTGLLRENLGFDGLVITDAINMAGTGESDPRKAAVRAVQAGSDLVLTHGARHAELAWLGLVGALESGALPRARAVRSAERLLEASKRAGQSACACATDSAFPERLARLAVTEIRRGRAAAIPRDALFVAAGSFLGETVDSENWVDLPIRPSEPQVSAIGAAIANSGRPVVAAIQNALQARVLQHARELRPEMHLTLILLGFPGDAASLPADRYIFTYSFLAVSQQAALEVLRGKRCAPGRLPVDVAGIAKRDGGDERCLSSEARESP